MKKMESLFEGTPNGQMQLSLYIIYEIQAHGGISLRERH